MEPTGLRGLRTPPPENLRLFQDPHESHMADLNNQDGLQSLLVNLREEHRDLDSAISALAASAPADQLQIKRLKKKKLSLKDRITSIEDQLTPDIIA